MQIVTHIGDESAGPSYSVPSLCGALQTLGCDVTLYTLLDVPEKDFNFEIKTFPISSFPTKALGRSPKMLEALSKDARNFDLIHSHMLWMAPNYYSGIVAKRYAIPYVCSPRGTLSEWALKRSVWKKKIVLALGQKKALSSVDCFHATAKQECREIKEAGYPNAHCAVIPNGIDIPDLFPKKTKPYKRLTFMSRIHPKKGLEDLIHAWIYLQERFQEWELCIVGPDKNEYAYAMKRLAKEAGAKRLTFTGEIKGKEKIAFLSNSDLFVLPTYSENFGMVVAEALACSVPVVCTKGAPWDGLRENGAGWWIEIGIDPLVNTLAKAMSISDEQRASMGENGRLWMQRDFSWNKIASDMIKVYEWLVFGSQIPSFVERPIS